MTVRTSQDGHEVACRLHLDVDDHIRSLVFDRWGDPDATGSFGLHAFGINVTATSTFGGLTIPSEGRAGWFHGTHREGDGEFFRFRIHRHATRCLNAQMAEWDRTVTLLRRDGRLGDRHPTPLGRRPGTGVR